ncbi:hypothetical protein HDU76_001889 [Blyttiomyces sp. JEL0837]|nr:hypothetical protein HDU76_001889 [Blyttiomyces sp. JEL0837]
MNLKLNELVNRNQELNESIDGLKLELNQLLKENESWKGELDKLYLVKSRASVGVVEELECIIEEMRLEIVEGERLVGVLKWEEGRLKGELERLKEVVGGLTERVGVLEEERRVAEVVGEERLRRVCELEGVVGEREREVERVVGLVTGLEVERDRLRGREKGDCEREVVSFKMEGEVKVKEVDRLVEDVAALKGQLDIVEKQKKVALDEVVQKEVRVKALEKEVIERESDLERVQRAKVTFEEEKAKLVREIQLLQVELKKLDEQNVAIVKEVEKLRLLFKELEVAKRKDVGGGDAGVEREKDILVKEWSVRLKKGKEESEDREREAKLMKSCDAHIIEIKDAEIESLREKLADLELGGRVRLGLVRLGIGLRVQADCGFVDVKGPEVVLANCKRYLMKALEDEERRPPAGGGYGDGEGDDGERVVLETYDDILEIREIMRGLTHHLYATRTLFKKKVNEVEELRKQNVKYKQQVVGLNKRVSSLVDAGAINAAWDLLLETPKAVQLMLPEFVGDDSEGGGGNRQSEERSGGGSLRRTDSGMVVDGCDVGVGLQEQNGDWVGSGSYDGYAKFNTGGNISPINYNQNNNNNININNDGTGVHGGYMQQYLRPTRTPPSNQLVQNYRWQFQQEL